MSYDTGRTIPRAVKLTEDLIHPMQQLLFWRISECVLDQLGFSWYQRDLGYPFYLGPHNSPVTCTAGVLGHLPQSNRPFKTLFQLVPAILGLDRQPFL